MKKNKLLILPLLACSLLASCDENTFVQNGSNPVGNVVDGNTTLDTVLDLQNFYEDLKQSSGGAVAVEKLIEKLASIEYSDTKLATKEESHSVQDYHTTESLQKEIQEVFEKIVDGTSYLDDDGVFDPEAYKEYVAETLDFEVTEGETSAKYIADADLRAKLGYNYDKYIEESVKPGILKEYIYLDYITGISKYNTQYSNQYGVELEVLKIPQDTTKLNGAWNEALIRDVKAVTSGKGNVTFSTDYSFVTFNSDNQLIVFESTATALKYSVYNISEANVEKYVPSYIKGNGKEAIKQLDISKEADLETISKLVADSSTKKVAEKSWEITANEVANKEYYEKVEDVIIARNLWKIDYEITLAKNYDNKTTYYDAMTETEKSEAKSFASTYSNSNAKPMKEVAKSKKLAAQQVEYYSEPDFYTKGTYTNVLPSALSSLRGTSAKDLVSHLREFGEGNNFLLPTKDTLTDPVYLDTGSSNYYVCEVLSYDGYFCYVDLVDTSKPTKLISNFNILAYQSGKYTPWKLSENGKKFEEDTNAAILYSEHPEVFEKIIEYVQLSAKAILTEAMKKEAIVALFEKYELEINDQDIYDYAFQQYPDYFEEEE